MILIPVCILYQVFKKTKCVQILMQVLVVILQTSLKVQERISKIPFQLRFQRTKLLFVHC
jgi:hypothetical protein